MGKQWSTMNEMWGVLKWFPMFGPNPLGDPSGGLCRPQNWGIDPLLPRGPCRPFLQRQKSRESTGASTGRPRIHQADWTWSHDPLVVWSPKIHDFEGVPTANPKPRRLGKLADFWSKYVNILWSTEASWCSGSGGAHTNLASMLST